MAKPRRGARKWRRYYLRRLPRRKRMRGTLAHRILGNRLLDARLWTFTREATAQGLGVGMFFGLMPFVGLQILLSMIACFALRVNIIAAVAATFVSNPFTAIGILYGQLKVGQWLLHPGRMDSAGEHAGAMNFLWVNGKAVMLGSMVTSVPAALLAYLLTLWFWNGLAKLGGKSAGEPAANS